MDFPQGRSDDQTEASDEDSQLRSKVLQHTLEEVRLTRGEGSEPPECCVICLEAITEPCDLDPCQHYNFDLACLLGWLSLTPSCPLCKATAIKVHHGPAGKRIATPIKPRLKSTPNRPRPLPLPLSLPLPIPTSTTRDPRSRPPIRRSREHARQLWDQDQDSSSVETTAIRRRSEVYIHKLYSKHVGSNRHSRFQELAPCMFHRHEELLSRARMWIRRELRVFSFLALSDADAPVSRPGNPPTTTATQRRRARNAEFLLEYIVAILKSMDIKGSAGQAEDMLAEYLGRENARLFWHELRAWLRSPYTTLEDWDEAVQYDPIERDEEDHGPGPRRHLGEDERERWAVSGHRGRPANRRVHRRRFGRSPASRFSPLGRVRRGEGDAHAFHC